MDREATQSGHELKFTIGIAAILYGLSLVLIDIAPFFIGLYVDHLELSLSQAGFVQTIDQAGGVLGAITGFVLMTRIPWRNLIIVASIIATIANVLTAIAEDFPSLLAIRFVSGFGVVLVTTVTACILARSAKPDRTFGAGLAIGMGLSALAIWFLDWLRIEYGPAISLGSGSVWLGVGLILAFWLPTSLHHHKPSIDVMDTVTTSSSEALGWAGLIALGLFGISVNVVYGYVERVGLANGIDPSGVANALAFGYVYSVFGCLVPTVFGAIGGRMKWIVLTTALFFLSLYVLYTANSITLFTIAFALYASVWNMGLAYYMALTSENDPKHRFTRALYIVNVAAQSIGPAVAAVVLTGASLSAIFVISPIPAIIAVILVIVVSSWLRAKRSRA